MGEKGKWLQVKANEVSERGIEGRKREQRERKGNKAV